MLQRVTQRLQVVSFLSSSIITRPTVIRRDGSVLYRAAPTSFPVSFPFSTSSFSGKKDLYSILGLTPKATQLQIKNAYYKLSMKYHPDRNHGSQEAASHFQSITEAYSVLGQTDLRRKYDMGLLREYPRPRAQTHSAFSHTHTINHNPSKVYDFDAYYKAHYGEALKREQMARARKVNERKSNEHVPALTETQQRLLVIATASSLVLLAWHHFWNQYGQHLKQKHCKEN